MKGGQEPVVIGPFLIILLLSSFSQNVKIGKNSSGKVIFSGLSTGNFDYECRDYSAYKMNVINQDMQYRHSIEVLHRYTERVILKISILTDIKRKDIFLLNFVFRLQTRLKLRNL